MVPLQIKLPENFLEEEVRSGYTVTREIKALWAVQLDLLVKFKTICEKYDISYSAFAGTMLGAVRHGGYIPWDDDVDIIMTRENYKKFCKVSVKELQSPYFLQTEETDPGSILGLAKLRRSDTAMVLKSHICRNFRFNQGIFVDIFVLDNIPDDKNELANFQDKLTKLRDKAHVLRNRFHCDSNEKSIIKKVLSKIQIKNYWYFRFEKYCQKFNGIDTEKSATVFYKPKENRAVFNNALLKNIIFMDFEFLKIPVFAAYDKFLTEQYGDYSKFIIGKSDHGESIIDTDSSYKKYLNWKQG